MTDRERSERAASAGPLREALEHGLEAIRDTSIDMASRQLAESLLAALAAAPAPAPAPASPPAGTVASLPLDVERLGDGPVVGPLTPKQVRILDNRHHRITNSVLCACGQIWAHCEVHRLIETFAAAYQQAGEEQ